jgi:hypothetical protein
MRRIMTDSKNSKNKSRSVAVDGISIAAKTATGVGVGLIGAAVGVAALATADIVLPALLCLKAAGVVGGGIGLISGVNSTKKNRKK